MHRAPTSGTARSSPLWKLYRADLPVLATAIHDGHCIDPIVANCVALTEDARLREEDPFTARIISGIPNRLTCHVSRFCVDLNRSIDKAVYKEPADAWNLEVWNRDLTNSEIARLQMLHQDYYELLESVLAGMARRHGRFVVLDVHSYNHMRDGPQAAPTHPSDAPDINIGTSSMDRTRWGHVVDGFLEFCRSRTVQGRYLDVRENVAFEGRGEQTRFIHERFPKTGCAIAVEFKKIFMNEWTGTPDDKFIAELAELLTEAIPILQKSLDARP